MVTIIIFVVVLLVNVLIHEWGHYIVAKKSGMLVKEFGFGIPPKIFSWQKGETEYSINALPIGGFVRIAGESEIDPEVPTERQFESKSWYTKSAVLLAGVVCNLLLAFLLFTVSNILGMPGVIEGGTPTVLTIVPRSAVDESDISVGDTIKSITINEKQISEINTANIANEIQLSEGPVLIEYVHLSESKFVSIEPKKTEEGRKIGIAVEPLGKIKLPVGKAISVSLDQTISLTGKIFSTIATLISQIFSGHATTDSLIGPVGLVKEVGNATTLGLAYLLTFTALISLNLAVLNVLPFPALDGGRLFIVWLEALFGRKFSPKIVGIIHAAGLLILLLLMILLTIKDVRRII